MSATSVSQQINPPVATSNIHNFSDAKVSDALDKQAGAVDTANKTDFRSLITNSMDEVKKARKAKENGDLSTGSDAEFLEKLSEQTKEKRVPKNELGKDDFLKLFVTQLQNQDPMNPDDGTEMAAKLAQFNGLEQMMNMNKGIEKLINAQGSDRNMQMINYIGKEVTVDGGRIRMKGGAPGPAEFTVEASIAAGTLEVRDGNGILVSQNDLPRMDRGTHPVKWDGKNSAGQTLPDGTYTFSISARNMDGDPIPVNITSKARITGVDIKDKDGALYSDFGKVTFDQIRSVGRPGFDQDGLKTTSTSDDLDRMNAEGKLNLKSGPSAAADAANGAAPVTQANNGAPATSNGAPASPEAKNGTSPASEPKVAETLSDGRKGASAAATPTEAPQGQGPSATDDKKAAAAKPESHEDKGAPSQEKQDLAANGNPAPSAKKQVDPKPSSSGKLNDDEKNPPNTQS